MTDIAEPLALEGGQLDEVEWEHPPRALRRESEAPVLSVDGFEGPLDWLLDLVRKHRLDLSRLSIVALIEAFATALEQALQQEGKRPAASSLWLERRQQLGLQVWARGSSEQGVAGVRGMLWFKFELLLRTIGIVLTRGRLERNRSVRAATAITWDKIIREGPRCDRA